MRRVGHIGLVLGLLAGGWFAACSSGSDQGASAPADGGADAGPDAAGSSDAGADGGGSSDGGMGEDAGGDGGAAAPQLGVITPQQLHDALQSKDFLLINVHTPNEGEIAGTDAHLA